jgi:hypothetical protein
MDVSGQLQGHVTLFPREDPKYSLYGRLIDSDAGVDAAGKKNRGFYIENGICPVHIWSLSSLSCLGS